MDKSPHSQLLNLVLRHYGVSLREIVAKTRLRRCADPRSAFTLLASSLGFDIGKTALYLERRPRPTKLILYHAINMYRGDLTFRKNIDHIYETAVKRRHFGCNPTTPQLYCYAQPSSVVNTQQRAAPPSQETYCPARKISLGFKFTEQDERRIIYAMRSASEFMATYGRGSQIPPIDKSHYIQDQSTNN